MQILNKKIISGTVVGVSLFVFSLLSPLPSHALGRWIGGNITQVPWKSTYQYIKVNDVKYTIMKDIPVLEVYKKDGTINKKEISLSKLKNGDKVLLLVEGNRIYNIEKNPE